MSYLGRVWIIKSVRKPEKLFSGNFENWCRSAAEKEEQNERSYFPSQFFALSIFGYYLVSKLGMPKKR